MVLYGSQRFLLLVFLFMELLLPHVVHLVGLPVEDLLVSPGQDCSNLLELIWEISLKVLLAQLLSSFAFLWFLPLEIRQSFLLYVALLLGARILACSISSDCPIG